MFLSFHNFTSIIQLSFSIPNCALIISSSGVKALALHHDTFGEVITTTGSPQTVFGFTGEQTDGTGQVYLRARYYNPTLGVFPSLDPLEGTDSDPLSLNRYAYVNGNTVNDAVGELMSINRYAYANGNPVNIVDPSGMFGQRDLSVLRSSNRCNGNINRFPLLQNTPISECHKFANEVYSIITKAEAQGVENDQIVSMLYGYFSGGLVTFHVGSVEMLVPHRSLPLMAIPMIINKGLPQDPSLNFPNVIGDRYRRPGSLSDVFENGKLSDNAPDAALAKSYGFKRQFYDNTHHYMSNFTLALVTRQ